MNYAKLAKKEVGTLLGRLRLERKRSLFAVAEELKMSPQVLDKIELGLFRSWKQYYLLLGYYDCRLGVIPKDK